MKNKFLMLCMMWILPAMGAGASHFITFFIRPLPDSYKTEEEDVINQKAAKQLQQHGKILKSVIKSKLSPLLLYTGIFVSYGGEFTHTNNDGQVTFERNTAEPRFHILVAKDIKAIPISPKNEQTLFGFTYDPKAEAVQYLAERKRDPETQLSTWYITPEPINKKKKIDPDTIIIFADPTKIIVPVGPSATNETEDFVLPDFYAAPHNRSAANAFRFFKIRHYFAPVKYDYKFLPDGYQQKQK